MTDAEIAAAMGTAKPAAKGFTDDQIARAMQGPSHEIPVGVRAPDPEPTVGDRLWAGVKGIGHTVSAGAGAVGQAVSHPIDTVSDPAKASAFFRGLDDVTTLGYGQKLADMLGEKLNYHPSTATSEEERQARAPGFRELGNITGMFIPGAGQAIGKGAGKAVANTLGRVPVSGPVGGAGMGVAKSLLGYEIAAPTIAAGQAGARGENPIMAARQAATDPASLAIAVTGGAISGAGQGYAAKARNPEHASGRALRDIEAAGGNVRATGKPTEGGAYELPEMQLPKGQAGSELLGAQSVDRILKAQQERYQAAQDNWEKTAEAITTPKLYGAKPRVYLWEKTHKALDALDEENAANGIVGDPKIQAAVAKARAMLTTNTGQIDRNATLLAQEQNPKAPAQYITAPATNVETFMKARKVLNRTMRHTTEPAEKFALGQIIEAMTEEGGHVDPRLNQLNAEYRQTMQQLSATNDALFGQKRPIVNVTESMKQSGAARLSRLGDESLAGLRAEPRMERFADIAPENAREVMLNRARKASERIQYGEPQVSTSMEKGRSHAVKHAVGRAIGAVVGGAAGSSHGPLGAFVGAKAGNALGGVFENPMALQLRLKLPVAEALGRGSGIIPGSLADQLYRAYEMEQQRTQERAAAVSGR